MFKRTKTEKIIQQPIIKPYTFDQNDISGLINCPDKHLYSFKLHSCVPTSIGVTEVDKKIGEDIISITPTKTTIKKRVKNLIKDYTSEVSRIKLKVWNDLSNTFEVLSEPQITQLINHLSNPNQIKNFFCQEVASPVRYYIHALLMAMWKQKVVPSCVSDIMVNPINKLYPIVVPQKFDNEIIIDQNHDYADIELITSDVVVFHKSKVFIKTINRLISIRGIIAVQTQLEFNEHFVSNEDTGTVMLLKEYTKHFGMIIT